MNNSLSELCCLSHSTRTCGMTPIALPPRFITVSAIVPIIPTLPPPYTNVTLCVTIIFPSSIACSVNNGVAPYLEPQKTANECIGTACIDLRQRDIKIAYLQNPVIHTVKG